MIRYFIGFTLADGRGYGSTHVEFHAQRPIVGMEDIALIERELRAQGWSNPVIMSFSRFEDNGNGTSGAR